MEHPALPLRYRRRAPYAVRLGSLGKHLYPPTLEDVSLPEFINLLSTSPSFAATAKLYVHLPFCERLCTFCHLHKYRLTAHTDMSSYIDAVITELINISRLPLIRQLPFTSIYFGGGTPSVTPDEELARIIDTILEHFTLENPQITFEGHVSSLTRSKIRLARKLGFNRLSAGVQTFDPRLRRALNLAASEKQIRTCVSNARAEGFDDFNLDLMFNIPGQTLSIWERDLRKTVDLHPSGIDIYETVVANNTKLRRQVMTGELSIELDADSLGRSYDVAQETLGELGYRQTTFSTWDQAGYINKLIGESGRLKNGSQHMVGVGLGAYSIVDGQPFTNETKIRDYIRRIREQGFGAKYTYRCGIQEKMERYMIVSLHDLAFDCSEFRSLFGREMGQVFSSQLDFFKRCNLVEESAVGYKLSESGRK